MRGSGGLCLPTGQDIILVDVSNAWCRPIRTKNLISNIVYNANGGDVTDVFIDGRHVMDSRNVTTVDVPAILKETQERAERIWSKFEKSWD